MGFMLGLKAFTAAVLGGIGNLPAPCSAACCWEALGAGYRARSAPATSATLTGGFVLGSNYQDVFAFFVLILVLVFRPSGLLGERVAERTREQVPTSTRPWLGMG
jgi:branched-chain amino acid transport system permease protein